MFKELNFYGHEKVVYCNVPEVGLKAIIGIHSTAMGPAVGGCRMRAYEREEDALFDVLRLSRGMSLKNAAANLGVGGGKSVIIANPKIDKTEEMLIAFAECVDSLGGMYYTAEDVGMGVEDLNLIYSHTKYALGGTENPYGLGDPSMATAYGTFLGMKAGADIQLNAKDLSGMKIAIQGVGNVGSCLVQLLVEAGAEVTVCDVAPERIQNIVDKYKVSVVEPDAIYDVDCDIFSPAAFGGSINKDTIPRLKAKLVVGAANNQLLEEADASRLTSRGIYFIPDFIVSCGGVTFGTAELHKYDRKEAMKKIEIVTENVLTIHKISKENNITTTAAAEKMAMDRISAAKENKAQSK